MPGVRNLSLSAKLEEVFHGGTLVLKTSQCQRSWHKRVRLLSLPPCCKRRREGMAPVRKTGALRSQWVRSPPLAPSWSHDLVAMMSACLAECESSILSGTAIFLLTHYAKSGTIEPRYEASGHNS